MSEKVKVGIVGAGGIGMIHAASLRKVPGIEVAALCDVLPDRLKAGGAAIGCTNLYADYRKLVAQADLDAVFVCTPNYMHHDITIAALKAGKHVMCEKPMAMNAGQAREMVAAARSARKLLQLGMAWRQAAESELLKGMIEDGYFGEIYHLRLNLRRRRGIPGLGGWFTTKAQSGGGCLIDIGVHFFDLVMWLSDNWAPERISAATYNQFGGRMKGYTFLDMWAGPPKYDGVCDVDDYATGFVRFKKCTLSFDLSWAANVKPENWVEIIGDKAGVRAFGDGPLTILTEESGRLLDVSPQHGKSNLYDDQDRKFIAAVQRGKPTGATGEQGLALMRVLDGIYKSAREGKEIIVGKSEK